MSRKANPAVVGGFVLGAVAIAVGSLFFFGGGKFFRTIETHVAFFDGSLKGLEIGAPVTFRGVRIGTVKDIQVVYDVDSSELTIPVIFDIDLDRLVITGDVARAIEASGDNGDDVLIQRGLRAQLQMRSMVTGQLAVNLDFFPNSEPVFHGGYKDYDETPTVPSEVEKLRDLAEKLVTRLQNVPVDEIATELGDLLKSMEALVSSEELSRILEGADRLINSPDLAESVKTLRSALESADAAMKSVRQLAEDAEENMAPLVEGLQHASQELGNVLDQAAAVLKSMESSLDEDSDLRVRTITAMEEVAAAARSVRVLTDYIERHPEALLKGKKEAGR
jgi:paraquat-inducible protein B